MSNQTWREVVNPRARGECTALDEMCGRTAQPFLVSRLACGHLNCGLRGTDRSLSLRVGLRTHDGGWERSRHDVASGGPLEGEIGASRISPSNVARTELWQGLCFILSYLAVRRRLLATRQRR